MINKLQSYVAIWKMEYLKYFFWKAEDEIKKNVRI